MNNSIEEWYSLFTLINESKIAQNSDDNSYVALSEIDYYAEQIYGFLCRNTTYRNL